MLQDLYIFALAGGTFISCQRRVALYPAMMIANHYIDYSQCCKVAT